MTSKQCEDILNTFMLANIPEIISQEEFDEVKLAIKHILQGANELAERNADAICYIQKLKDEYDTQLVLINPVELLNKLGYVEEKKCVLCDMPIGNFNDNGIYEGEYCEECFNEAQNGRL